MPNGYLIEVCLNLETWGDVSGDLTIRDYRIASSFLTPCPAEAPAPPAGPRPAWHAEAVDEARIPVAAIAVWGAVLMLAAALAAGLLMRRSRVAQDGDIPLRVCPRLARLAPAHSASTKTPSNSCAGP